MGSNETKHVRTELSDEEYEQFRKFAREQGLSLKEAGHEAVLEWIERQRQPDPSKRAFTVLDELEEEPATETTTTDARDEIVLTEEWHGDEVSLTLADEPANGS